MWVPPEVRVRTLVSAEKPVDYLRGIDTAAILAAVRRLIGETGRGTERPGLRGGVKAA